MDGEAADCESLHRESPTDAQVSRALPQTPILPLMARGLVTSFLYLLLTISLSMSPPAPLDNAVCQVSLTSRENVEL